MSTLTPAEKAAITRKRNEFLKELKEKQEFYRTHPRELAAEIARRIREDEHANEDPENYTNGVMHWYQESWGRVKVKFDLFKKVTENRYSGSKIYEVSCPTTGCVAGWATTLAGYPMAIKAFGPLKDEFEENDVIEVNDCHVNGELQSIVDTGQELLGLGRDLRMWLFDGYNSKEQVLWGLDKLAAGEALRPEECPYNQDGNLYDEDELEDAERY